MRLIVTLFFLLGVCLASNIGQVQYDLIETGELSALLKQIEKKHHVTFSFNADWVSEQSISLVEGQYNLTQILEFISNNSELEFEFVDGQNIIITKQDFQNRSICVYLQDAENGEPIEFASIYTSDKSQGTTSNPFGYFELALKTPSKLIVSFLGYKDLVIDPKNIASGDCPTYELKRRSISFSPVILKEYLTDGIQQSNLGNTVIISPGQMKTLPGAIDKDVLSAIQFLPGINSPDESLNSIHIRGGTPDQNLFLWDDIPVFHTSHLFGSISAFNPFMIDHVEVYRGGVGSEFGGRVSGVVDIQSRKDIAKSFEGSTGFNLTHMYLNLSFPLWKNSSIDFSIRRSITDAWNTPTFISYAKKVFQGTKVENVEFGEDEFKFNDASFKWQYQLGSNLFVVSSIGALNNLNFTTDLPASKAFSTDFLNLDSRGVKIAWEKKWSERLSSKLHLTSAVYDYDYSISYQLNDSINSPNPPPFENKSSNTLEDGGLTGQVNYQLDETQNLKAGFEFKENKIGLLIEERRFEDVKSDPQNFTNRLATLFGGYSLNLPKILQIDVGLRYQNQRIINKNYFEPRIALSANISEALKLKASTDKNFQFISQLAVIDINDLGFSDRIWVAANDTIIPVIESNQWMVGLMYQKNKWTIDVEGYVKEITGISTFTSGFADLELQPYSIGDAIIRGVDVLVKRRVGKYKTWLSYTLSESLYEFGSISKLRFPASHNRTQLFQWVNMYTRGNFEYSLGLQTGSPLPYTPAYGLVTVVNADGRETTEIDYGAINSGRLKSYYRLDASIVYNYKVNDRFNGYISLGIQNLSNYQNINGKLYSLGDPVGQKDQTLLNNDVLGLGFTPNLSMHLAW